jgi:hypothetical protein
MVRDAKDIVDKVKGLIEERNKKIDEIINADDTISMRRRL